MTLPFFGSGVVELPPEGYKRAKNSRKMQMCFFVHEGKVMVEVGASSTGETNQFAISKGGVWVVPRGKLLFSHSSHSLLHFTVRFGRLGTATRLLVGSEKSGKAVTHRSNTPSPVASMTMLEVGVDRAVCVRRAVDLTLRCTGLYGTSLLGDVAPRTRQLRCCVTELSRSGADKSVGGVCATLQR